ncbi:MAG: TetR/AcrR family transcriptional regulator [Bacteroidota bacterium]
MSAVRDTKQKILNLAEDLFQRKGYNAFSYHHIAVELGIKNAAIHYHYPTKEALCLELVKRDHDRFTDGAVKTQPADWWEKLNWFFGIYEHNLKNQGRVCMVASVARDYLTLSDEIRNEAQLLVIDILEWLTDLLHQGKQSGICDYKGTAEAKAVVLAATMAGSLLVARIGGQDQFYQIVDQIKLELTP